MDKFVDLGQTCIYNCKDHDIDVKGYFIDENGYKYVVCPIHGRRLVEGRVVPGRFRLPDLYFTIGRGMSEEDE